MSSNMTGDEVTRPIGFFESGYTSSPEFSIYALFALFYIGMIAIYSLYQFALMRPFQRNVVMEEEEGTMHKWRQYGYLERCEELSTPGSPIFKGWMRNYETKEFREFRTELSQSEFSSEPIVIYRDKRAIVHDMFPTDTLAGICWISGIPSKPVKLQVRPPNDIIDKINNVWLIASVIGIPFYIAKVIKRKRELKKLIEERAPRKRKLSAEELDDGVIKAPCKWWIVQWQIPNKEVQLYTVYYHDLAFDPEVGEKAPDDEIRTETLTLPELHEFLVDDTKIIRQISIFYPGTSELNLTSNQYYRFKNYWAALDYVREGNLHYQKQILAMKREMADLQNQVFDLMKTKSIVNSIGASKLRQIQLEADKHNLLNRMSWDGARRDLRFISSPEQLERVRESHEEATDPLITGGKETLINYLAEALKRGFPIENEVLTLANKLRVDPRELYGEIQELAEVD